VTTNTWKNFQKTEVSNLRYSACAIVGDDTILISGGTGQNGTENCVWSWNFKTNLWKELPSLVEPRHSHGWLMKKNCLSDRIN
jgi:hypothetical protein